MIQAHSTSYVKLGLSSPSLKGPMWSERTTDVSVKPSFDSLKPQAGGISSTKAEMPMAKDATEMIALSFLTIVLV